MDHNKVAKRIADAVGKDNIVAAAHCATRLRLVIKDVKKDRSGCLGQRFRS